MPHMLYQVDAFTDVPFKGNPAAVITSVHANIPTIILCILHLHVHNFSQLINLAKALHEHAWALPAKMSKLLEKSPIDAILSAGAQPIIRKNF